MQTIRVAQNLKKFRYEKGDIFAVIATNNHQVAPVIFAALCNGNPLSTLDTAFSETEIGHMLSITKPKAFFCELDVVDLVKAVTAKSGIAAQIFTFCGSTEGTTDVADLFIETGREEDFL